MVAKLALARQQGTTLLLELVLGMICALFSNQTAHADLANAQIQLSITI